MTQGDLGWGRGPRLQGFCRLEEEPRLVLSASGSFGGEQRQDLVSVCKKLSLVAGGEWPGEGRAWADPRHQVGGG